MAKSIRKSVFFLLAAPFFPASRDRQLQSSPNRTFARCPICFGDGLLKEIARLLLPNFPTRAVDYAR